MKLNELLIISSCFLLTNCTNQGQLDERKAKIKSTPKNQVLKKKVKPIEIETKEIVETKILPTKEEVKISARKLFPVKIEFGAAGKGSKLPRTTFEIRKDSVLLSYRSRFSKSPWDMKTYSIETKKTKFVELFSHFFESDFLGSKRYYEPGIRDGGFMRISTRLGERIFANLFSGIRNKSQIKPGTTMARFEAISKYSKSIISDLNEKAKEKRLQERQEKQQKSIEEARKRNEKLKQES